MSQALARREDDSPERQRLVRQVAVALWKLEYLGVMPEEAEAREALWMDRRTEFLQEARLLVRLLERAGVGLTPPPPVTRG